MSKAKENLKTYIETINDTELIEKIHNFIVVFLTENITDNDDKNITIKNDIKMEDECDEKSNGLF